MRFFFPKWFFETVRFEGKEFQLLYDCGNQKKRVISGFDISDTRPFLWGRLSEHMQGKKIEVRGKNYTIERVEATGEDSYVYYLGETRNAHRL